MKKKLMALIMALAVLCTCFAVQMVAAEEETIDENLRAWFNFSDESYVGWGAFLDARGRSAGVGGIMQSGVTAVEGLNGNAMQFSGAPASLEEIMNMQCASAIYIQSETDLFAGENVTINVVYKQDNNEQIQPLFYAGTQPAEFMAIKTSWTEENVGPQLTINKSANLAEQKVSVAADIIPEAGTWNMLTVVQSKTKCKIYLNGKLVKEDTLTYRLSDISSVVSGQHTYILGAPSPYNDLSVFTNADFATNPAYFTDPGFKGLIDDFRIYGDALTQKEIHALATSLQIAVNPDDLIEDDEENDDNNENSDTTPANGVVLDLNTSNPESLKDVVVGNGITLENGKAVFAAGNQGVALPDDIFADAEVVTIEMTLQPSAFANYTALLCVGNQNGKWAVMGLMEDGSVRYAIATNGDDKSESKGNSTTSSQGNEHASYQSGAVLSTDKEYAVKYVITQTETNVYIDGELALTVPTPDKDAIGTLGGPVVLGKATKWTNDPSYQGTMTSLKITLGTISEDDSNNSGDDSNEGNGFDNGSGNGTNDGDNSGNQDGTGDADNEKPVTGDVPMPTMAIVVLVVALASMVFLQKSVLNKVSK